MTVDNHDVTEPPLPGGIRTELIRGTLTLASGTATETITLKLDYDTRPIVNVTAVQGSTTEDVNATITDDDPTGDDTIAIRLSGTTDEDKDYHVQVIDPLEEA